MVTLSNESLPTRNKPGLVSKASWPGGLIPALSL